MNHYYIATMQRFVEYRVLFEFPSGQRINPCGWCEDRLRGVRDAAVIHNMHAEDRRRDLRVFLVGYRNFAVIHYYRKTRPCYMGRGANDRYGIKIEDPHGLLSGAGDNTAVYGEPSRCQDEPSTDRQLSIHYAWRVYP